MKFLTPAEKVIKIRKYLKMSQGDLQDEYISRGLISMIEIGKRSLTKDVATKFVEKFKERAKKFNINLEIDENYLLRSPSEDAEIYCFKKLSSSNIGDNIDEIFEISCEFNLLNIKAAYYGKKADFSFDNKEYHNAFQNYNNAIFIYQSINKYEKFPYLYWKIGLCQSEKFQYKEALSYFNICQQYSIMYKDAEIQQKSLYDKALCYKKLNKLDLTLECINNYLLSNNKKDNNYFYAIMLKANCYKEMGENEVVIDIYNNLCKMFTNPNDLLLGYIYNNLGIAYLDKSNFKSSLKYFRMAEDIRSYADKENLCYTLVEKSNVYIRQSFYTEAIKTVKSGLKYAYIYKNYECLLKGNYTLLTIYESINDITNLKETYFTIVDILKEHNKSDELVSVYDKLALIYLGENDVENAKHYLTLSQKLNTYKY